MIRLKLHMLMVSIMALCVSVDLHAMHNGSGSGLDDVAAEDAKAQPKRVAVVTIDQASPKVRREPHRGDKDRSRARSAEPVGHSREARGGAITPEQLGDLIAFVREHQHDQQERSAAKPRSRRASTGAAGSAAVEELLAALQHRDTDADTRHATTGGAVEELLAALKHHDQPATGDAGHAAAAADDPLSKLAGGDKFGAGTAVLEQADRALEHIGRTTILLPPKGALRDQFMAGINWRTMLHYRLHTAFASLATLSATATLTVFGLVAIHEGAAHWKEWGYYTGAGAVATYLLAHYFRKQYEQCISLLNHAGKAD